MVAKPTAEPGPYAMYNNSGYAGEARNPAAFDRMKQMNANIESDRRARAESAYFNPQGQDLINQLQQQLSQMQLYGASPAEMSSVQMRLQQAMSDMDRSNQRNVALYGAGGGDNSYMSSLIGMGASPGQYQPSNRYASPVGRGPGPMRQR
jgi:hypothetical protein